MNWRYFLRGLGAGILLATLVLCMTYRKDIRQSGDVVKQAKELGMVFPEGTRPPDDDEIVKKTEEPETSDEPNDGSASEEDGDSKQNTEEPDSTKKAAQSGEKSSDTDDSKVKKTAKPKATEKTKTSGNKNKSKETTGNKESGVIPFTLRNASTSIAAARELQSAGLIDDALKFDSYLVANGYSPKIRGGQYNIPRGASYEQIARILSHQTSY